MNSVIVMTQTSKYEARELPIVHKPLIKIEPLSFNMDLLKLNYDWILFSSKNAVKYFYKYLEKVNYTHVATIGEKTKAYCESLGLKVDFSPSQFSQEGFISEFQASKGSKILIPSSNKARPYLVDSLLNEGYKVRKIDLYEPIAWTSHVQDVLELLKRNKVSALTFASSSAVKILCEAIKPYSISLPPIFVIGRQTLTTLRNYGFTGEIAEQQTIDSLITKVKESWFKNEI
ncbi:uroporphyrinogen-III synthase [Staphylococcus sp. SQ8-PEA]|uniref:Uroporphyrinogen-III synthase n=1 Tax=Staphylococcus marylandisciuri TaxID=2981529 RepID=A0ABT2QQ35_9STAP|nr:uroporphyrinogen-III synthase [Staphylococcus marylandisciuri]MCU5746072.1 uroporphyrinogen-III synthase [Staphylococcus marylandisciuri]